jgi:hypothetical protein
MKSTTLLEERPQHRQEPEPHRRRRAAPSRRRDKWAERLAADEGPDAAWYELLARIARGGIIRGHLL